jgi:hypothetical protein
MKMKREDSQLLPLCKFCGKYKGIGLCKDPACPGSMKQVDREEPDIERDNGKERTKQPCVVCGKQQIVTCTQCGEGYCETHSIGAELNQLGSFHQRVGTCVECQQVVCEKCWILNPNGDIICLTHLEKE